MKNVVNDVMFGYGRTVVKYPLDLDLDATGTKTVLFNERGLAICSQTVGYPIYQPFNSWAEKSTRDWWNSAGRLKYR